MKKLLTLFIACATGTAVYAQTYSITGSIERLSDGDTVTMTKADADAPMAYAVIKNGKFKFTGKTDPTIHYYINYKMKGTGGRQGGGIVFLEKGNLKLTSQYGGPMKVYGSKVNDAYRVFYERLDSLYFLRKRTTMGVDTLPQAEREIRMKKYAGIEKEMTQLAGNAARDNINNAFGIYMMGLEHSRIEPTLWDQLYDAAPDLLRKNKHVALYKQVRDGARNTQVGKHFVDFELLTPEGKKVRLSDYVSRNKVTMLDFWASWCGPCCAEIPSMKKALSQYGDKGFGIVGVSVDNQAEAWKKAIEKYGIGWPQMSDLKGGGSIAGKLYGLTAIPATYLIDQNGIIVAKNVRGEAIATKVGELLDK